MSNSRNVPRRWLILAVIAVAQLMVVLDISIVNIALPSAQVSLHFSNTGRQWIITAYALAFGSLLLFGGKLGDVLGRKTTFITGLIGFAAVSAVGGAATSFAMLVAARACQGAFGALLAPAALSLLTTTFSDPGERGKAFGIYGSIVAGGGAVGLLLGGVLTEYLSWRWTLYVNLFFALIAVPGAAVLLRHQPRPGWHGLDLFGVLTGGGSMFCLVYGFSNAASYSWHTPSTWGCLAAGGALLVVFAVREALARNPLLPPAIVTDRNRGGANLAVLAASAGMFGIFLFLTYYMQKSLGFTPVASGVAFLPMIAMVMVFANLANIVLLPRIGPKPLVFTGLLAAAGALAWLTRIGPHTSYEHAVLGPIMLAGAGFGFTIASAMNTGTFGVAAASAGVASAALNTMQQIGGSIGTSLLNTVATRATSNYAASHKVALRHGGPAAKKSLAGLAQVHGYTTAFWWSAAIFAGGAILAGSLLRLGRPGARPGRHVRGHVLQASGPPVPGASVTLTGPGGQQAARTRTGPEGEYDIKPPGSGTYTLTAAAVAHQPAAAPVLVQDRPVEVDMRLTGTTWLAGVVRTRGTGSRIPDATVTLEDSGGTVIAARRTDHAGYYRFDALPAASYILTVAASSCRPAALPVIIGEQTELIQDIELEVTAQLRGTIRTAGGTGIPDARVSLADESGGTVGAAVTGPDGDYVIAGISDGRYTLTASGYPPVSARVEITAGPAPDCGVQLGYPDERKEDS